QSARFSPAAVPRLQLQQQAVSRQPTPTPSPLFSWPLHTTRSLAMKSVICGNRRTRVFEGKKTNFDAGLNCTTRQLVVRYNWLVGEINSIARRVRALRNRWGSKRRKLFRIQKHSKFRCRFFARKELVIPIFLVFAAYVSDEDGIHAIRKLREDRRIHLRILFAGITHEHDVALGEAGHERSNLLKLEFIRIREHLFEKNPAVADVNGAHIPGECREIGFLGKSAERLIELPGARRYDVEVDARAERLHPVQGRHSRNRPERPPERVCHLLAMVEYVGDLDRVIHVR